MHEGPGIREGDGKMKKKGKKYLTKWQWQRNTKNHGPSSTTATFVALIKKAISIPLVRSYEIDLNRDYHNCFPNRQNTCFYQ